MTWDITNGIFEFVGGLFIWLNVRRIYHDKCVHGVSPIATCFFVLWGIWGLFYYPAIGQFWSTVGAVNIVMANTVWVSMMWWYTYGKGKNQSEKRHLGIGAADSYSQRETKV